MEHQEKLLIVRLWDKIVSPPFELYLLIEQIKKDGGLDVSELSDNDISRLFNGEFIKDWDKVIFAFSALLGYYSGCRSFEDTPTAQQAVGWFFAALIIRDAIRLNKTDWEMHLHILLNSFLFVDKVLEPEDQIEVLTCLFQKG